MKDHLGSIRAVTNESHDVLSAQDYDMWGQILDNRSYEIDEDRYKFTGKERDFIGQFPLTRRGYDYFGARYYDARVGRWGSIDSLFEKHFDFSPYNYVLDNPLMYIDPDGRQVIPKIIKEGAKQVGKKMGKKTAPGDLASGFGEKGYDVDNDGIDDSTDEIDNRDNQRITFDNILYEKVKTGEMPYESLPDRLKKVKDRSKPSNIKEAYDAMIEAEKRKEKEEREKEKMKEIDAKHAEHIWDPIIKVIKKIID